MRTTFKILFVISALQQPNDSKLFVNGLTMHSDFLLFAPHVYFRVKIKGDKVVELRINPLKEKLIQPITIQCFKKVFGKDYFNCFVDETSDNGFSTIKLRVDDRNQWMLIDSGIKCIHIKTDKQNYEVKVFDDLKELKNFANGKEN